MRRSAALAATAAVAVVGLVPVSPAAAAAKPTHVAIVLAGHGVACVPWHSGITGDELLNDVATVKYRPTDGIITQIDGQPANNRADDTHYWSYWHNTGSGWTYSTAGASAYHPRAGSVDGWHFINGSATATPPPARTYASICHDTAVAPVAPVAPPTTPTPGTTARSSVAAHPSAATVRPASSGAAGRSSSAAAPPAGPRPASAAPRASSPSSAASGPTSVLPALQARNAADAPHRAQSGSALPTVLVVAIVLALGGIGATVTRRRRRSG